MITLEKFIETHGRAAMRIARADDLFNECLVLPFAEYVEAYNGEWGTVEGYILMRLRYAVLKYQYKEAAWVRKHGEPLFDVEEQVTHQVATKLAEAITLLDPEIQHVVELWAHGNTHAEISRELQIDMRKVRARISAGLDQLREELTDALRDQEC